MSDPRQFERDQNPSRESFSDNRSGLRDSSVWIAAIVAILIVFGAVAYYGGSSTGPNSTGTTSGQATRAPEPATPPAMPAPAKQP